MNWQNLSRWMQQPRIRDLITVGFYTLVCVVWSWPQASGANTMVCRHFDILGTLWVGGLGQGLGDGLVTPLSGWPEGLDLRRTDSLVLLLLSAGPGRWLENTTLLALVILVGPVLSAWAAERFAAHVMGARWPFSLLAGLTYAFSGIAATALLEGHPYILLNPWLPLLAWQWHRCTGPGARLRHGLLAGLLWLLCLLTSAYTGLAATLWVVVAGLRPLLLRRLRSLSWRPLAAALALMACSGGLYLVAFASAGKSVRAADEFRQMSPRGILRAGSTNLADLAGVSRAADSESHSMVPALGFLPLVLALAALRIRPARGPWLLMLGLGLLSVAVALGPVLRGSAFSDGVPWVLTPLIKLELASFFRFPVRLMFIAALALGALAAAVASRLYGSADGPRRDRLVVLLLPLALLDLYICTGMPGRTGRWPLELPRAYASLPGSGALLHLMPELHGTAKRQETFLSSLDCAHQQHHGLPLLTRCAGGGDHRAGPRFKIGSWLRSALLSEAPPAKVSGQLAALGVSAVVWRPDLFLPADRARLRRALTRVLGAPRARSTNGADHVVLHTVRSPSAWPAAREAYQRFLALRSQGKTGGNSR